jgi:hypothetical protein
MMNFMIYTPHLILMEVNKSRIMRWAGHAACMGERKGLMGKPE